MAHGDPTEAEIREYTTSGGLHVRRESTEVDGERALEQLIDALDTQRGMLLASTYDVPGRYSRWDMGFVNPPVAIEARGRTLRFEALNERGKVLLPEIAAALQSGATDAIESLASAPDAIEVLVRTAPEYFPEEQRSRTPSVFSFLRAVIALFSSEREPHLGIYGAFGYDLAFQFESLEMHHRREPSQRDLVLYLPDELLIIDHPRGLAMRHRYDFVAGEATTASFERSGEHAAYAAGDAATLASSDHEPGEYAEVVRRARESFARGDLFEVTPSQVLSETSPSPPSELFRRLRERNPSPYGFLANLGESEYLVGASPEMYVRVGPTADGRAARRVETCPIAGTIARGIDSLSDAQQIRTLLNSAKDESELTMCTDVDRNDKSRICEPGSIRVLARRQIEMYSRLIHTVDHIEGTLREEFDGLDAFLSHTWAVTVTGAPKRWAMQFIEKHEKSPRRWYGGAVGVLGFDGTLNTGLTLRTIHIQQGIARVRVGATLLYDSDPEEEEAETLLKASAFLDALRRSRGDAGDAARTATGLSGEGRRVLLVDAQDSFVHTLADYFRQNGAQVTTLRVGFPIEEMKRIDPDLVVLSPGPGRPEDFPLSEVIEAALQQDRPLFGVCLGLQAMTEHFGGRLGQLPIPVHGKPSEVRVLGGSLLESFPQSFRAGRYHSLYAHRESLPEVLLVTAEADDGIVMAIEHESLPLWAVQFHPESILTLDAGLGLRLIGNVLAAIP